MLGTSLNKTFCSFLSLLVVWVTETSVYFCTHIFSYTLNHCGILNQGNVLFNDANNTFYLRLYLIRHMVKHHSESERGILLLPHGLLFPISSKSSFICTIPVTRQHIPMLFQSWSTDWNNKSSVVGPLHERTLYYRATFLYGNQAGFRRKTPYHIWLWFNQYKNHNAWYKL